MAECGRYLGKGVVTFPCVVEAQPGQTNSDGGNHRGPCMAMELPRTIDERRRWEEEERHASSGLGEFQGRPQTTAERYTENPTPVPESREDRIDRLTREAEQKQPYSEPTKTREGDQPLPVQNDGPAIQDLVIADLEERKRIGIQRYGGLLQSHNGRDAMRDLYEELIDALVYLKQVMVERDSVSSK